MAATKRALEAQRAEPSRAPRPMQSDRPTAIDYGSQFKRQNKAVNLLAILVAALVCLIWAVSFRGACVFLRRSLSLSLSVCVGRSKDRERFLNDSSKLPVHNTWTNPPANSISISVHKSY